MELSDAFKRFRKTLGITQKQAAAGAGVAERLYQSYEYGKVIPSATVLVSLADYFDVPLDYLTGRGLFENWDEIMQNKDVVLSQLLLLIPGLSTFHLADRTERELMYLLGAFVEKISIDEEGRQIDILLHG